MHSATAESKISQPLNPFSKPSEITPVIKTESESTSNINLSEKDDYAFLKGLELIDPSLSELTFIRDKYQFKKKRKNQIIPELKTKGNWELVVNLNPYYAHRLSLIHI